MDYPHLEKWSPTAYVITFSRDFTVHSADAYGYCLVYNMDGKKKVQRPTVTDMPSLGHRETAFFKGMKPSVRNICPLFPYNNIMHMNNHFLCLNFQEGLQLILTSYTPNNMLLLSPVDGFRLAIHHPWTLPDPFEEGFDINMQTISSVGMSKVEFEQLHPKFGGNCALDSFLMQHFDPRIFNVTTETPFSKEVDETTCIRFPCSFVSKITIGVFFNPPFGQLCVVMTFVQLLPEDLRQSCMRTFPPYVLSILRPSEKTNDECDIAREMHNNITLYVCQVNRVVASFTEWHTNSLLSLLRCR